MRTEYEIRMDFNKAMAQVGKLNAIASRLGNLADDDLYSSLNNIERNWDGENSEAFLEKGHKAKDKINRTAEKVKKVADTIETIAKRTMEAELAAIRIAEE